MVGLGRSTPPSVTGSLDQSRMRDHFGPHLWNHIVICCAFYFVLCHSLRSHQNPSLTADTRRYISTCTPVRDTDNKISRISENSGSWSKKLRTQRQLSCKTPCHAKLRNRGYSWLDLHFGCLQIRPGRIPHTMGCAKSRDFSWPRS